ncbi:MAG: hypothetical protein NT013_00785 [Planctomycetia bacterium]|nr:hypothetical protein [Planctomycetia bacterium]
MKPVRLLSVLLVFALSRGLCLSADRSPLPSVADLKQLQASVKDVFKADIAGAKSRAQQSALAERMVENVQNDVASAGSDYALLTQAHAMAVKASNTELSLKVARLIGQRFDVDEPMLIVQTLKDLAKGPTDKEYHQTLAEKALSVATEQIAAERFDTAKECYEAVSSIGLKLKSADLSKKAVAGRTDLIELKKLSDKLPTARQTLEDKTDDPAANDVVGRFEIIVKGDWNTGLPLLAKSSDTAIKQAAEQDLKLVDAEAPASPEEADVISQRWWELSQKQTLSRLKQQLKLRAGQWAEYAAPDLKGFSKTKAEQRLSESEWTATNGSANRLMSLNRMEAELEGRFANIHGMITKDFAICQAAKLDEALAISKLLSLRKLRPIRFRPYWTAEGPLVAAIWHRDEFSGELFDGSEYEVYEHDKAMRAEGWLPCDVAGYPDKQGVTRFVLTSVRRPLKEKEEIVVQIGWLDGTQAKPANERGMWFATIHTWIHTDGKRYSDMVLNKPVSAGGVQGGSTAEWTLKNIAEYSKGKGLVGDVGMSVNESGRHYATWTELREGVTESVGFDKTHEETVAEWQKLAADGFRPAMIAAAHDKKGKYYSFWTWRKKK